VLVLVLGGACCWLLLTQSPHSLTHPVLSCTSQPAATQCQPVVGGAERHTRDHRRGEKCAEGGKPFLPFRPRLSMIGPFPQILWFFGWVDGWMEESGSRLSLFPGPPLRLRETSQRQQQEGVQYSTVTTTFFTFDLTSPSLTSLSLSLPLPLPTVQSYSKDHGNYLAQVPTLSPSRDPASFFPSYPFVPSLTRRLLVVLATMTLTSDSDSYSFSPPGIIVHRPSSIIICSSSLLFPPSIAHSVQ
jgi:hypothetical protein